MGLKEEAAERKRETYFDQGLSSRYAIDGVAMQARVNGKESKMGNKGGGLEAGLCALVAKRTSSSAELMFEDGVERNIPAWGSERFQERGEKSTCAESRCDTMTQNEGHGRSQTLI